jgi:hypothetical protein
LTLPADIPAYLRERDAHDARLRAEARPHVARQMRALRAEGAGVALSFPASRTLWEERMVAHGMAHARATAEAASLRRFGGGDSNTFGLVYYDRARCMYNIADHTLDRSASSPWVAAANDAEWLYRADFLEPGNYQAPGYWTFGEGMAEHFRRTGDVRSRDAVLGLAEHGAFSVDLAAVNQPDVLKPARMARENAYALMVQLAAQSVGAPPEAKTDARVADAFDHFDQWFVSRTVRPQPFVVALWAESLIRLDATLPPTHGTRARILDAIRTAYDSLWASHWRGDADGSFSYIYDGEPARDESSHDLNLLIVPPLGWLYARSKGIETRHQVRGDLVFAGGVTGGYWQGEKQFNQMMRWSFDYVAWRGRSWVETYPPSAESKRYRTAVLFDRSTRTVEVKTAADVPADGAADGGGLTDG